MPDETSAPAAQNDTKNETPPRGPRGARPPQAAAAPAPAVKDEAPPAPDADEADSLPVDNLPPELKSLALKARADREARKAVATGKVPKVQCILLHGTYVGAGYTHADPAREGDPLELMMPEAKALEAQKLVHLVREL